MISAIDIHTAGLVHNRETSVISTGIISIQLRRFVHIGSFVSANVRLFVLSSASRERAINVLQDARAREREREREKGRERPLCPSQPPHAHARARAYAFSATDSACRTIIAIMPTQFTARIITPRRRRSVPLHDRMDSRASDTIR
jgi:hypothetical protein